MGENIIPHNETIYTHGHSDAVLRSHRWRTATNSAAYLLPHLRPGLSLLDVGCGPGTLTVDLATRVAPGAIVGVDVEPSVVTEAQAHANRLLSAAQFVVGDFASVVSPRDGGFDVVHAHQVLQHVGDPVGTLRAMAAFAAPDGLLAVRDADYPAMVWWPRLPALDRWLDIYMAVTSHNGANADAGRRLLSWAQQTDLRDINYSTSTWTFTAPDDIAWWSSLWAERTTSSRFGEQAVAYGIATADELHDVAEGWQAWGQVSGAVFVVLHGEILARPPISR